MARPQPSALVPWVLLGVVLLIGYGSLYPFDFKFDGTYPTFNAALNQLTWARAGRADRVRNVLLYVPLGFCLMWLLRVRLGAVLAVLLATLLGSLLSFSIELLQVYLTIRVPSWMDLSLNASGTFIGAVGSSVWRRMSALVYLPTTSRSRQGDRTPLVLLCTWVLWRLAGFDPNLSLARLKLALRPLLEWNFSIALTLRYLVMWLVVAQAVFAYAQRQRSNETLFFVITLVMLGRLLFVTPPFIPAELLALMLLLPALIGLHNLRSVPQSSLVLTAFSALFVYDQLMPFDFGARQHDFDFWPFLSWIKQGMPINPEQLLRKLFLFGGMIWLLKDAGMAVRTAIFWVVCLVSGLEVAHLWQADRIGSITDPVLALLMGLLMYTTSADSKRRYAKLRWR